MSVPSSPAASASEPATPRARVQALLAQFSDSDSDENGASPREKTGSKQLKSAGPATSNEEIDSEDDDVPVLRKSRMAMRLEAGSGSNAPKVEHAPKRTAAPDTTNSIPSEDDESSDVLSRPALTRRLLTRRKTSPIAAPSSLATHQDVLPTISRPSPLRLSSPSGSDRVDEHESATDDPSTLQTSGMNPRFKALVERQRKLREEKEEAERAKQAARLASVSASEPRRQRGSSPGDDSHESSDGSDAEAAQKIANSSKPTRKASKKAVEEMKRETQRMSRNMQLAHQAQVKKRFTKDSFFARFNRTPTVVEAPEPTSSRTASPDRDSDADHRTTPPTSPMEETICEKVNLVESTEDAGQPTGLGVVLEAPTLEEIGLEPQTDLDKGKGTTGQPPMMPGTQADVVALVARSVPQPSTDPITKIQEKRSRIAQVLRQSNADRTELEDEDEDLEIISSKGDVRKYAAFEKLPKRKAQETSSHLALRALAQIGQSGRNGSTMTASELQSTLRREMREQARRERQEKIEELRAKGIVIQTAEERDRDQQEVEDIVEKARQEAVEISRREKEAAKKDGTFVKDGLDDESDDEDDDDFLMDEDEGVNSEENDSDDEIEGDEDAEEDTGEKGLFDDQADEVASEDDSEHISDAEVEPAETEIAEEKLQTPAPRRARNTRVLSDDEDDIAQVETPTLPQPSKTPQSLLRSTRKQIPGLHMSDDTPLGLTQAFDATMADTQTQEEMEEEDTIDYVADLPSPGISIAPRLNRLESLDIISDSQPASQTQPLDISLSFSQSHFVPESPSLNRQHLNTQATPSQAHFEPTQDEGYLYSPFTGNRFASETPQAEPHSTVDTVALNEVEASPVVQRRNRLRRGRAASVDSSHEGNGPAAELTAFEVMRRAAKRIDEPFDKTKSNARGIVDEAAEESDDEYAGLGGASDDDHINDVENDDDRQMIDHDANVGHGDEAALAGYHADHERKADEAGVSKLYQDITTGRLRRRRGINDELDLSDEKDAAARRREAKRREFAKMRRELLKDEAVGKIAEDKKKEAFFQSLEDRQVLSDDDDFDEPEPEDESQSQSQPEDAAARELDSQSAGTKRKRVLDSASEDQLNRLPPAQRRNNANKKPATLSEIRENLSFLVEEVDSQGPTIDLGLSDSEEEPEAYVDLDRHAREAEADENAEDDDGEGLGDFIVDDETPTDTIDAFKKPSVPASLSREPSSDRASAFAHRRSTTKVVNRLSLIRQSSSSAASTKMAFSASNITSTFKAPTLLRRATTNSSLSSMSSGEGMSATGVTVAVASKTERGHVSQEKAFVRKGNSGRRNAVNFQAGERPGDKMSGRAGVGKKGAAGAAKKKTGGFLGDLLGRRDTWG